MLKRIENAGRVALKKVTFKRRLPLEHGGAKIHVSPGSDLRFLTNGWLAAYAELLQVAANFVRSGDHVWDIGANVGVFTFAAIHRVGDAGSVLSFEPDPELSALLSRTRRSLSGNQVSISRLLTAAVAEGQGILDLIIPINGSARNHLSNLAGNSAVGVYDRRACVSLSADWLLSQVPAPNFCKIDVEGGEISVLNGAERLLRAVRPALYIEVGPNNAAEASQILRRYEYELFCSHSGTWLCVEQAQFNTLAIPKERVLDYLTEAGAVRSPRSVL